MNAVVHRDYAIAAPIQIRVYVDRLYIWNPGELPKDWSVAKLLGQHPSRPFNPDIANAFFRFGEIESWGRGIQHIFEACEEEGTPDPIFKADPGELQVEFHFSDAYLEGAMTGGQSREGIGRTTQETTIEIEDITQEKILALLREHPELTHKELAEHIGITPDGIKFHLDNLWKSGRILRVGSTKKGHREVKADSNEQCWPMRNSRLHSIRPLKPNPLLTERVL